MIWFRPIAIPCFCLLLLPILAQADEVEVRAVDGHVIASTTTAAPLSAARALLGSPSRIAAIEGRGSEVTSRAKGQCIESEVVAPSGVGKIRYTALSCPVGDGFEGSLVSSKQIRAMEARWTLSEKDGRLRVQYDLFVVPRIRVPQRLVALLAKRGVRRLVESVRDELDSQVAAGRTD
jgi:hypothetical protein